MFNSDLKKQALADLEEANKTYNGTVDVTTKDATKLYRDRKLSVETLQNVEDYINELSNVPREYIKIIGEIKVRCNNFQHTVQKLEAESQSMDRTLAAQRITTTLGIISTESTLVSGISVTSAATLFGGGALAAGGGGMAAGNALLALAGPVGWAIGGTALIGSGILASTKNKEIAEKAEASTRTIKKETEKLQEYDYEINNLSKETRKLNSSIDKTLTQLQSNGLHDFLQFSQSDRNIMVTLLNSSAALSKKIGITINK